MSPAEIAVRPRGDPYRCEEYWKGEACRDAMEYGEDDVDDEPKYDDVPVGEATEDVSEEDLGSTEKCPVRD